MGLEDPYTTFLSLIHDQYFNLINHFPPDLLALLPQLSFGLMYFAWRPA